VTEGNLEEDQHLALEKQLEEKMMGYKNAGRPPVFEAGIKWQSFAITPRDMDWISSDKMNSRKICAVFNVAPELIGDAENKTYSNYQEARKALYLENILPLMDYLKDEYNNWLTPMWEGERLMLEYDKESIEAIREELTAVYTRQAQAHWRTINEKRKATGDDDIGKAGDVILVPANLIPLSDISFTRDEE
jgi:HK97 family phage portal protein